MNIHETEIGTRFLCQIKDDGHLFPYPFRRTATLPLLIAEVVDRPEWGTVVECDGKRFGMPAESRNYIDPLPEHYPVCSCCSEPWPCRAKRIDGEAIRFAHEMRDLCTNCGERINGAHSSSFGGMRFHTAKKYRGPDGTPCRAAEARAREEWLSQREAS